MLTELQIETDSQFESINSGKCNHCGEVIIQEDQRDHIVDDCEHVPKEIRNKIEGLKEE